MTPGNAEDRRTGAGDHGTAAAARRRATEDRLRAALAARADLLTHRDLRRDAPPQGHGRGVRRLRGAALGVLGLAAAVVAVCLLVLLPGGPQTPAPVVPAGTPGISEPPPPTPTPTGTGTGTVGPSPVDPRVTGRP
ncbi:hypothetical protein [Streptomyces sp. NPDC048442]|uniref:hypothetical protein n=1 Tax=Streptomyces sp. NPDC048442 TaxID=3154823 RepID=UPI0034482CE8